MSSSFLCRVMRVIRVMTSVWERGRGGALVREGCWIWRLRCIWMSCGEKAGVGVVRVGSLLGLVMGAERLMKEEVKRKTETTI